MKEISTQQLYQGMSLEIGSLEVCLKMQNQAEDMLPSTDGQIENNADKSISSDKSCSQNAKGIILEHFKVIRYNSSKYKILPLSKQDIKIT